MRTRISLKSARVNANMNAEQVGKCIGKSEKTIYNWENALTAIPTQYFFKLCKLYNIDPDYVDVPIVKDGFFYEDTTV